MMDAESLVMPLLFDGLLESGEMGELGLAKPPSGGAFSGSSPSPKPQVSLSTLEHPSPQ